MEGNAQKMREALAETRLLLARVPRSIKPDVACGIIAAKAKHALADPPRHCDRFETLDEAKSSFAKIRPFPPFMTSDADYNPHRAYAEWFAALSEWLMSADDAAQEGGAE